MHLHGETAQLNDDAPMEATIRAEFGKGILAANDSFLTTRK